MSKEEEIKAGAKEYTKDVPYKAEKDIATELYDALKVAYGRICTLQSGMDSMYFTDRHDDVPKNKRAIEIAESALKNYENLSKK